MCAERGRGDTAGDRGWSLPSLGRRSAHLRVLPETRYCTAMSEENVETIRHLYAALADGHFGSALDIYDPEVVFVQRDASNVFGSDVEGVYFGIDGLRDYMRKFLETWSDVRIEVQELIEAGDSLVAPVVMRVVGRASGVPAEFQYVHLWSFRGRSVIRLEVFPTREQALEAVGLSE